MSDTERKIIDRDNDILAAKRSADEIIHLLTDFIPRYCRRDAWNLIAETYFKHGVELTSKVQRKEYEVIKQTIMEMNVNALPR